MKLFALWKYDLFPYLLGGTVTKLHDNGIIETEEYGMGNCFKPVIILPVNEGRRILNQLDKIRDDYLSERAKLAQTYHIKLKTEFPGLKQHFH